MSFERIGIRPAQILLPAPGVKPETWACIACDQYTSEPRRQTGNLGLHRLRPVHLRTGILEKGLCRRRGRAVGYPADPAGI